MLMWNMGRGVDIPQLSRRHTIPCGLQMGFAGIRIVESFDPHVFRSEPNST